MGEDSGEGCILEIGQEEIMGALTRDQVKALLANPTQLPSLTERRWNALKEFVDSNKEFTNHFQPTNFSKNAWRDTINRLNIYLYHHRERNTDT